AGRPGSAQGTAPTLLLKVDRLDAQQLGLEPLGNPPRRVGADVVSHGKPSRKWEPLVEIGPQSADAPLQVVLLVVDRHDDVDDWLRIGSCDGWHGRRLGRRLFRNGYAAASVRGSRPGR